MQDNFFEELNNCQLTRNKNLFYTLGREDFDRLLCVHDRAVFTPDASSISEFAAVVYLLAILDMKITNFTSIPAGYLASFAGSDNTSTTMLINASSEFFIRKTLIKLCESKEQTITDIYYYMARLLKNRDVPLLEVCQMLNDFNICSWIGPYSEKISSALKAFDELNQQNCENNHKILRACLNPEDDQKYDEILGGYILPGYLS